MKRHFISGFAVWIGLSFAVNVTAQTTASVSGTVTDDHSKNVSAAVSLLTAKDSSVVKTVLTDETGKFIFTQVKEGNYLLLIDATGFKKYYSSSIPVSQQNITVPSIPLATQAKELAAVTVSSVKSFTEQKLDRTVVNVDALISNTGSTALEVLEKTPGVTIDENGTITFKGKSGVLIMIDDKPTYLSGTDLATYLRSLPSSALDKIELMDNPPAKYDAAGNAGVINIKTKKSKTKGFNGSVSANFRQSFYAGTNESANLNYATGKINFFANLGYNLFNNGRKLEISRTYLTNAGTVNSIFRQENYFKQHGTSPNAKMGFDYFASANTTWGLVYTGSLTNRTEQRPTFSGIYNAAGIVDSSIIANNYNSSDFHKNGLNVNYTHKFDSTGKVLSFDIDYIHYLSSSDQHFANNTFSAGGSLKGTQNLLALIPSDISIYAAKIDYSQSLPGKVKLEAGIKSSYVSSDNEANYFNINGSSTTVDYNNTNHFIYRENINAAYVSINKEMERFSFQGGLRLENTNGNGHQLGNLYKPDSAFTKHYTSIFPTFYTSYKLDSAGNHQLIFSLGRRIDRPNYQDLNPFVFILDKFTSFSGNPFLRPQFANEFKLSYTYKNKVTFGLTHTYMKDVQIETIEQNGTVFISRTGNIGEYYFAAAFVDANLKIAPWWTASIYAELDYNNYRGALYSGDINQKSVWVYTSVNNQFTLGKGWSAELGGFYCSPRANAQFDKIAFGQLNPAIQKKIWNNKGTIRLSARDIFNSNTSTGNITNIPNVLAHYSNMFYNRTFTIGFTYSFGKQFESQAKRKTGSADTEAGRAGN